MNWSLFLDQSRYHDWIVVRVDQCISHYRPLYPTIAYYSLLYLSIYLYIYMCVYIYIYRWGKKKTISRSILISQPWPQTSKKQGHGLRRPLPRPAALPLWRFRPAAPLAAAPAPGRAMSGGRILGPGMIYLNIIGYINGEYLFIYVHIYIYNYIYSYVVNIYEYLCEKLNNGGIHQHCVTIDYRLLSFIIDSSCLFWTI
jgi:hypothetical protein